MLQLLVNGIALGAAYALIALGFVLVINAIGAVNFAQGDLVMTGGFVAVILADWLIESEAWTTWGLGVLVLPLTMVAMAALGILFSLFAYVPLRNRPPVSVFISTIAFGMMLQHGANAAFGPDPRNGPPLIEAGMVSFGSVGVSLQQISVIVAATFLIGTTRVVLFQTQFGRQLRATAQDQEMAEAIGVDGFRSIGLTFALAVALAGAAGMLLSNQFFVTPTDGGVFMLKAYIAVTLGGWGRLDGATVAAILIGIFEVMVAAVVSYVVAEALLYATLLLVLLLRPSGFLAESIQRRT
ncbi:MAG: branched-chain amino acid ABC transporter permease [Rhodospirillaceae bacterium]|nr:branched-chain amino acid ABC transporter permease [Rhodospirillaceae bacterium]